MTWTDGLSQVSNARIMNQGTHQNIMNQLGMTSDEYNLVTVVYYVCQIPEIICLVSASNL
jgi:hypothetical protein